MLAANEDHGPILGASNAIHVAIATQCPLLVSHCRGNDARKISVTCTRPQRITQTDFLVSEQANLAPNGHHTVTNCNCGVPANTPRRALIFPSAVMRSRLHEPQKCSLMEVMKPT